MNKLSSIIRLTCLIMGMILEITVGIGQYNTTILTSDPLTGSDITDNARLGFQDIVCTTPSLCSNYRACYYKTYVHLGIDPIDPTEQNIAYDNSLETITVTYDLNYIDHDGMHQLISDLILKISYNPYGGISDDQQIQIIDGGYNVEIKITDVDHSATGVPEIPVSAYIQLEMEIDRFQDLDVNATQEVTTEFLTGNHNFIQMSWPEIGTAESYELEWTWVDSEIDGNVADYDYRLNSSRIETMTPSYTISNVYRTGILMARVRGVGRSECDNRVVGEWHSNAPTIGTISLPALPSGGLLITDAYAHNEEFNWQHSRTFTEGSRQKDVISYFDGSMRSRQSVTRIESDQNAIIAESYYDHIGRPAVQALPAPMIIDTDNDNDKEYEQNIDYYPNFNVNLSSQPYNRSDFESGSDCNSPADELKKSSGAGRYYSSQNPHKEDQQAYVPDANGHPLSHTIYTQDGTNRVRFQGGVGSDHQIGGGHDTKYYYAKPSPSEIDRLFGNEAGYAQYYNKNMVIDPNGQASISYLDNKGRVIATALAGDSPKNPDNPDELLLDALPSESLADIHEYLLGSNNPSIKNLEDIDNEINPRTLTATSPFLVPSMSTFDWQYSLTPAKFTDMPCLETEEEVDPICFDCIYTRRIIVSDDCNIQVAGDTDFVPVSEDLNNVIDIDCYNDIIPRHDIEVSLNPGGYKISKTLKLDQAAQDAYEELYMAHYSCAETVPVKWQRILSEFEFGGCIDQDCAINCNNDIDLSLYVDDIEGFREALVACMDGCEPVVASLNTCQFYRDMMIADLTPGGQYASVEISNGIPSSNHSRISIFNTDANTSCFANYTTMEAVDFVDESGNYILVDINGTPTSPNNMTFSEFYQFYTESWIEALLPLHPEYHYLMHCESTLSNSYDFDDDMLGITTIEEARTNGYLNPVGNDPSHTLLTDYHIGSSSGTVIDPLFSGADNAELAMDMRDNMINFQPIVDEDNVETGNFYSIWDISYLVALGQIIDISQLNLIDIPSGLFPIRFGDYLCESNYFWQTFSRLYQSLKAGYVDASYANYMDQNVDRCNNQCIGNADISAGMGSCCDGCEELQEESVSIRFTTTPSIDLGFDIQDYTDPNNQMDPDLGQDQINDFNERMTERCTPICESYKDQWRFELAPCFDLENPEDVTTLEALLENMVEICVLGCDIDHPYGSSSTPDGTSSFASAMTDLGLDEDNMCNSYLISEPSPYGYDHDNGSGLIIDQCNCERYNEVFSEFEATGQGTDLTTFHGWLTDTYHIDYEEDKIVNLDCACRTLDSDIVSATPLNLGPVPRPFACISCIDCEQMSVAYNGFLNFYDDEVTAEIVEDPFFERIMTNWLNDNLGFNLIFSEYRDFMLYCGRSLLGSGDPQDEGPSFSSPRGLGESTLTDIKFEKEYISGSINPRAGEIIQYKFTIEQLDGDAFIGELWDQLPPGWSFVNIGDGHGGMIDGSIDITNDILHITDINTGSGPITFVVDVMIASDIFIERVYYNQATFGPQDDMTKPIVLSDDPHIEGDERDPTGVYIDIYDPCLGQVEKAEDMVDFLNYLISINLFTSPDPAISVDLSGVTEFTESSVNLWSTNSGDVQLDYSQMTDIDGLPQFVLMITNDCGAQELLCGLYISGIQNLGDVAEFLDIRPLILDDNDMNDNFTIDVLLTNGNRTSLLGSSSCYNFESCEKRRLCNRSLYDNDLPPLESDCLDDILDLSLNIARLEYETEINEGRERFRREYPRKCLGNLQETLTQEYTLKEYHYTLYYYDQSGNLIRTIPPEGVDILDAGEVANVQAHRSDPVTNLIAIHPNHTFVTHYTQDSYNNTVTQDSPDADQVRMWYDELGRVIVSQDGRQRGLTGANWYSYTIYDEQSRIIEVGELESNMILDDNNPMVDYDTYLSWQDNAVQKRFVSRTIYDENLVVGSIDINTYFDKEASDGIDYIRPYLRKRVSSSLFYNDYDPNNLQGYNNATHYDYDVHGNVKTLIQDNAELRNMGFNLKRIDYTYDLVSGNVNEVWYQHQHDPDPAAIDHPDAFYHRYTYDADNRITQVETSKDHIIWDTDAEYMYYVHGPLARTEIGDHKVQGIDYAYTIHGWIKGVNSNTLDPSRDMGKDGDANDIIAADAYGYSLGYYTGDYTEIAGLDQNSHFLASEEDLTFSDLYNGNISRMVSSILNEQHDPLLDFGATSYRYDQLHRITGSEKFTIDPVNNQWVSERTVGQVLSYKTNYSYDANGNIKTLYRFGNSSGANNFNLIDGIQYTYETNTNRLNYISDGYGQVGNDLDNQDPDNYAYDGSGNLISDVSENITNITWDNYGKIRSVSRNDQDPTTLYRYDAMGNRVVKYHRSSLSHPSERTYYIRDAQGNVMATYKYKSGKYNLKEHHIYGSSRLGIKQADDPTLDLVTYTTMSPDIKTRLAGKRNYELTNHLGNVLSVVSDNKLLNTDPNDPLYRAEILRYSDYYPFGWEMPGRTGSLTGADGYRYGFNGKEKDGDLTGNDDLLALDYGFRIYNPAIGRFLSVDPLTRSYPMLTPYQFASDSPIANIDLDGLEARISIFFTSGYRRYITDHDEINEFRNTMRDKALGVFKIEWYTQEQKLQYLYSGNDQYDGIYAGDLSLRQKGDELVMIATFDDYTEDRLQQVEDEKMYQGLKWSIRKDGIAEIIIGTVGMLTASVEELYTGGMATTLVITQVVFSMDEFAGGVNKLLNTKEVYNGLESKPIKYLIGEFIGEDGKHIYNVIDITVGVNDIPKAEKLIDLIGIYDTASDAESAIEEYKQKNNE